MRRTGRLHPPPDPRAGRPGSLGGGVRRPALARPRRGSGIHACPRPRSLPPARSVPCPALERVHLPGGLDRVRHHVHGRVRGAPGLLAAGPPAPGAATRRVRRRARQPVPGQRHAGHGRGRVAPVDDVAPSHHGRPPARPVAHDEPVAAIHDAPLVRFPRHAGAGGPCPARGADGVAELAPGHRGPNGRRARADDRGPRRGRPHGLPPLRGRHAGARAHHGHVEQRRPR